MLNDLSSIYYYDAVRSELRCAWFEHYRRKGCNEFKAWRLALTKTHTWPPR